MRCGGILRLACVMLMLASRCAVVAEEPPPITLEEIRALRQRLDQAEAQIQALQQQSDHARPYPAEAPRVAEEGLPPMPDPAGHVSLFEAVDADDSLLQQLSDLDARMAALQTGHDRLAQDYDRLSRDHDSLLERYDTLSSDVTKGKNLAILGAPGVTLKLGFRVHADYWTIPSADAGTAVLEGTPAHPISPQDHFGFRRIRLTLRGDIRDNMLYKVDIEMADPGNFQWRDVYLGWRNLPVLQEVLVGNQKLPYGLDALNSSNDNIFLERPLVVDAFDTNYRRLGICAYGVSEDERWNWRYGAFCSYDMQPVGAFYYNDHYQPQVAARLANTWWYDEESDGRGYAHWAISGAVAHPDGNSAVNAARFPTRPEAREAVNWIDTGQIAGAEWYQLIGMEQVFNAGPLQLVGEAYQVTLQRDVGSDLYYWGAYGYLSYFLTGEHMPWNRKLGTLAPVQPFENFFLVDRLSGGTGSGWGAWQVAARYSYLDASSGDVLGGVGHSTTLGLVWYFNPNARMQFNWIHGWIGDNADLQTAGLSQAHYDILGLRCQIAY